MTRSIDANGEVSAESLEYDLGFALGAVFRAYVKAANLVMDEVPGGARGYQIVSAATRGEVENQRGLARRIGIDRTVMTYLLDDLEAAGLVIRRPSPVDRRQRHIVATDKGRKVGRDVEQRLRLVEDHILEALSAREQQTLRELLGRTAAQVLAYEPVNDSCEVVFDLGNDQSTGH